MKAEHRHQLHTNVLADRMGRLLQGMKSAPKSTSTLVWVFVLLALATFAVWQYTASATMRDRSALWTSVDEATHDPGAGSGELQAIERDNPGTIPARTAGFQLARWKLQQGLESIARDDRLGAVDKLAGARDLYARLVRNCVDVPLLAQEAMMGMATAEESLAGIAVPGNAEKNPESDQPEQAKSANYAASLDKALEYYRDLAKKYPDSILGKKAAERAKELEQQTSYGLEQQTSSRSKIEQFYAEASKMAAPKAATQAKGK